MDSEFRCTDDDGCITVDASRQSIIDCVIRKTSVSYADIRLTYRRRGVPVSRVDIDGFIPENRTSSMQLQPVDHYSLPVTSHS